MLLTSGSSYCRGQPGRISCPSILSQFLAHKQPLLEMVPYIYNLSFKVFLLIFVQLFLPRAVFVPAILKGCGQFLGHLYPILFYVFELSSKKKKKKPTYLPGLEEKPFSSCCSADIAPHNLPKVWSNPVKVLWSNNLCDLPTLISVLHRGWKDSLSTCQC